MTAGSVAGLYRWPVKSLRGERVERAVFDARGMAGDRAYGLLDARPTRVGNKLTGRQSPELLRWTATYAGAADGPDPSGPPTLTGPDGAAWAWEQPGLAQALGHAIGAPVELRTAAGQADRGPTVLVTVESSRAALEAELGGAVDVLRFRPNLHLELDVPPFAELDWGPGTRITAGPATLEVTGEDAGPCIRCAVPSWRPDGGERWPKLQSWLIEHHDNVFGSIMRVVTPGEIAVGDRAVLAT
ncbi:MAG: MOSC domain-containing protein [Streptosporangiales bacterium]|nr:MOSC domain-containing protein [Streptosporangiales bacterium]